MDNGTNFGQIAETGPKVVQRIVFLVIIWKFQKNFLSLHHDYARGDAHSMTEDPLVHDYGCARPSSFLLTLNVKGMENVNDI